MLCLDWVYTKACINGFSYHMCFTLFFIRGQSQNSETVYNIPDSNLVMNIILTLNCLRGEKALKLVQNIIYE